MTADNTILIIRGSKARSIAWFSHGPPDHPTGISITIVPVAVNYGVAPLAPTELIKTIDPADLSAELLRAISLALIQLDIEQESEA